MIQKNKKNKQENENSFRNSRGQFIKGTTLENIYGSEKAKELKRKLSESNRGKNNPMYGIAPQNKGKKGLYKTSEEVKTVLREYRKNQKNVPENNPLIGKKISAKLKGKTYEELYGKEKADEIRAKRKLFIETQYKLGTPNLGFPKDGTMKEARKKQVFPLKDTKIEVKLQNYLKQLGIEFITHQYIDIKYGYQADILIPVQHGISQKVIIEADGDYWHCNPKKYDFRKMPSYIKEQVPLDFERTLQLEEAGFKVLRLWESDINKMIIGEFHKKLYNIKSNMPIIIKSQVEGGMFKC
jgi:very-short-patch-repair endonuclease